MCGIVAIFAYHYAALPVDQKEFLQILDHMHDRGPDAEGIWISKNERVALGHKRLSILDPTSYANQPMISANKNLIITFNGQIYNYKELKTQLEKKGYQFSTQSDTEVLLYLFQEKKEQMVHDLRGMFAFAIWDQKNQKMFMARDPYGIKPLYYADDGWTVRIASQVKALVSGNKISGTLDSAGCAGFYLFGSVPEPHTLYRSIRALSAGSYCWIDQLGTHSPITYFSLAGIYCEAEKIAVKENFAQSPDFLQQNLQESLKSHLIADVPIGFFLSAGLDSATLIGLMNNLGYKGKKTITLAFPEFTNSMDDESNDALEIARCYEMEHVTRQVSFEEFKQDWPCIIKKMDQPSIDGINTWFASKAAKELGLKVIISGIGGDELFGGYSSFNRLPFLTKIMSIPARIPILPSIFRKIITELIRFGFSIHPKNAGIFANTHQYAGAYLLQRGLFLTHEFKDFLNDEFLTDGIRRLKVNQHMQSYLEPKPKNSFSKIAILESCIYMRNQLLRDADWAGMAHGIEIRTPFVDSFLIKSIAPLLSQAKPINKKAILGKIPHKQLPQHILNRRKTGFNTPINDWLNQLYPKENSRFNYETSRRLAKILAKEWGLLS